MTLSCGPKLLIADELTTALDVTTQAQILKRLRQIALEDKIGILLITHDLSLLRAITDHLLVLQSGRVIETGATADVLSSPLSQAPAIKTGHRFWRARQRLLENTPHC